MKTSTPATTAVVSKLLVVVVVVVVVVIAVVFVVIVVVVVLVVVVGYESSTFPRFHKSLEGGNWFQRSQTQTRGIPAKMSGKPASAAIFG